MCARDGKGIDEWGMQLKWRWDTCLKKVVKIWGGAGEWEKGEEKMVGWWLEGKEIQAPVKDFRHRWKIFLPPKRERERGKALLSPLVSHRRFISLLPLPSLLSLTHHDVFLSLLQEISGFPPSLQMSWESESWENCSSIKWPLKVEESERKVTFPTKWRERIKKDFTVELREESQLSKSLSWTTTTSSLRWLQFVSPLSLSAFNWKIIHINVDIHLFTSSFLSPHLLMLYS